MLANVCNVAKGFLTDWDLNLITQKGTYNEELASFHKSLQAEVMS